jgi:nucleoside 2-deoxyribosyltransferase
MKYYFAARFRKRALLRRYRKQLTRLGHECVSHWIDDDGKSVECAAIAARDAHGVAECDALILFLEPPRTATRCGRMVECGLALGQNKPVLAVGPEVENVFIYLTQRFDSWEQCLTHLGKHGRDRRSAAVKNQVHDTHLKPAKRDHATIARRESIWRVRDQNR